eukprot:583305-Pelagomonas_calceolata.AAC.1
MKVAVAGDTKVWGRGPRGGKGGQGGRGMGRSSAYKNVKICVSSELGRPRRCAKMNPLHCFLAFALTASGLRHIMFVKRMGQHRRAMQ